METDINKLIEMGRNLEKEHDEVVIRTLKDMSGKYSDQEEIKAILKHYNPLIYKVFVKKSDDVDYGVTVIYPGTIGKEYYMTKGHNHNTPSPETYILLEGEGKLIIERGDDARVLDLKRNEKVVVPEDYAHRTVNTGTKQLKFLAIYDPKAGHNYNTEFKKRLFKE